MNRPLLLSLGFILLCLTSCDRDPAPDESDVLARIGGHTIRISDLESEAERLRKLGRPPASHEALLDEMIAYQILLEQARQADIDQDPEVRRAISNLLIGTLKAKELAPALEGLTVSEAELADTYEERRRSFVIPEKGRFSIIQIESSELIDEALKLARQGDQGFTTAAAKFSSDQVSRYRSGDIGWNEPGKPHARIPPQVLAAGHALASDGDLSEDIETDSGFYLIKRTAYQASTTPPLEKIAAQLRARILQQKRQAAQQAFEERMASSVTVERFPDRVAELQPLASPKSARDQPPPSP